MKKVVTKHIFIICVFGLLGFSSLLVYAQKFNEEIYTAYILGEMDQWKKTMSEIESVQKISGSKEMLYDLVVAQYGYIAYLITAEKEKEARAYVKDTEAKLKILLRTNYNVAKAHAMLGALYGFKVKLNPLQAIVYGKRAFDENTRASELAPDDPQVLMEKGNIEFYKPAIFGSDPREASKIYQQAISNFEKDPETLKNNWMYLNTMISIANAYIASEEFGKANETYKKILKREPGFKWVYEKVYPEFRKKYGY